MIGIIVNPNARRGRDPQLADRLQRVLRDAGAQGRVRVVVTRDLEALREAIARFQAEGVSLIATCGGDGTTMATLTEIVAAYGTEGLPRLLLLRGGSVNTIARNLGVGGRPEQILATILTTLRGPEDLPSLPLWTQDLVRVRARAGGKEAPTRYGCLFAAAMGARFLESYYAAPRQGLGPAALLTARTVLSTMVPGGGRTARRLFAETEADLWINGEPVAERRFRLILGATVPDVGLGMRVTWQAGRAPGRMHVVASRISTFAMARQLGRVRRGEALSGDPHIDRLARSLRVRFPAPEPYTLDGDLFYGDEVEVDMGPTIEILGRLP